jgi:hypothetical protein
MSVSCELHVSAALSRGMYSLVSIGQEVGWGPRVGVDAVE